MSRRNSLIFGPTGSGKTGQLGELAEFNFAEDGLITRLYTADHGGFATIAPHVKAGLIEPVILTGQNPWAFAYAVRGMVPDPTKPGAWHMDEKANARIGHWSFEGLHSWAYAMMRNLADRAAGTNGRLIENVGGKSPIRFNAGPDHPNLWIGSNNESHYGVVQGEVKDLCLRSFDLPGTVAWTTLDLRGEDKESGNPVIAPYLIGKSGAENIPSWFHQTFHLVVEPATESKPPVHKLFLVPHKDASG